MDNFIFNFRLGVQEYTCTVSREWDAHLARLSAKTCKSEYLAGGSKNSCALAFKVIMTFATTKGEVYRQEYIGDEAASFLRLYKVCNNCIWSEGMAMSAYLDTRFVKRMAKRTMATRLESLRLDGKRKAAYGWGISNGRKRTSVTSR